MWRAMMKFIHGVVAVLSLLSVGQSAPVSRCESLTQAIEISGREQLLGKWTHIAESTTIPGSKMLTKLFVDNMWAEITAANESDAISVFQSQKVFGSCFTLTTKMTLKNSTLLSVKPFNGSGVLLYTSCSDCLVSFSNYTIGEQTYHGLQLQSRRNKVTAAELEEFTKQVECLNLPSPAILDPEKGFCQDEILSQTTEATDLTSFMNEMGPESFRLFERIISSAGEGAMQTLFTMIHAGGAGLKEY